MDKVKNALIRCLLFLGKCVGLRSFSIDNENPRILIISSTGLGDTLWGVPALRQLRHRYPNAYIGALTSPIGKEVLKECPYLDTVIEIENPVMPSALKLLKTLRKEHFQIGYVFHLSQRPILPLCILGGLSKCIGTASINKGLDFLLTHKIEKQSEHEIVRRLRIVDGDPTDTRLEFFPSHALESPKKTLIGMHPGAKDTFKMWDEEYFTQVGKALAKEYDAQIIVTGSAAEAPLARSIADSIPGAVSVAGKFSLSDTAALMQSFSLMISNDTGPMHLAFALSVPTIALFCATDPKLCGPLDVPNATVISASKTCFPCLKKRCKLPFCLKQISPSEVIEAANGLLQKEVSYA